MVYFDIALYEAPPVIIKLEEKLSAAEKEIQAKEDGAKK